MQETPFQNLIAMMSTLRSADGCPWDREQTPESLVPYIAEEACETIEAIAAGNTEAICEELGDLLLQIVFQSQIFQEQGAFTINDVIASINDKLIRRHPHVFGDHPTIECPKEQSRLWEKIKEQEKSIIASRDKLKTPEPTPTNQSDPSPALTLALTTLQNAAQLPPSVSTCDLAGTLSDITTAESLVERNRAIDSMILLLASYRKSKY